VYDMGNFAVYESKDGYKYSSCKKKINGNRARFGRDLSSTTRRYDLILEFWYVIWGTLLFMRVKVGTGTPHTKKKPMIVMQGLAEIYHQQCEGIA
jgi:hypothetical protein